MISIEITSLNQTPLSMFATITTSFDCHCREKRRIKLGRQRTHGKETFAITIKISGQIPFNTFRACDLFVLLSFLCYQQESVSHPLQQCKNQQRVLGIAQKHHLLKEFKYLSRRSSKYIQKRALTKTEISRHN